MENTSMSVGRTPCVSNLSQSVFMEYGLCVYDIFLLQYSVLKVSHMKHLIFTVQYKVSDLHIITE